MPTKVKSKGFTLIELISVIILMGVIALITVPIIKDTIESSREKNFKNSALGLIEAANEYYLSSKLNGELFEEIEFKVNNGKMVSGDKELSFNGKVPVGDSYVKIKSNGDIAINITDGEFYATKDYDEVGTSIGTSEESALLREELIKKINELEKKVDSNTTSIENNKTELISKIENNTTNINKNITSINDTKTSILNLTNKENSNNVFLKTYPVGSIYISTSSANPSAIYGGTWERYGQGKTLVGLNESEPEFSTVNKIGGEKTHTLTISEMPRHTHSLYMNSGTDDLSRGFWLVQDAVPVSTSRANITEYEGWSQPHNNLQPYITVYMWKRIS